MNPRETAWSIFDTNFDEFAADQNKPLDYKPSFFSSFHTTTSLSASGPQSAHSSYSSGHNSAHSKSSLQLYSMSYTENEQLNLFITKINALFTKYMNTHKPPANRSNDVKNCYRRVPGTYPPRQFWFSSVCNLLTILMT